MFEADENGEFVYYMPVSIPIMDDTIDEAMDQVFIAVLGVTDALELTSVELGRDTTVCRIMDDDSKFI